MPPVRCLRVNEPIGLLVVRVISVNPSYSISKSDVGGRYATIFS